MAQFAFSFASPRLKVAIIAKVIVSIYNASYTIINLWIPLHIPAQSFLFALAQIGRG